MDNKILSDEHWSELWEAINLFDQKGDRTILNQVLVTIMKNIVETLDEDSRADDDFRAKEENDMDKQLVITLVESELAEMIAVNACPSWCCRHRQVQPFRQNNHKFSDYLINIARAKSFDKNNSGFISKEIIQRIFTQQLHGGKMQELLQFVEINSDGDVNYKEFATLLLITR